jgi:cytidine deaminase
MKINTDTTYDIVNELITFDSTWRKHRTQFHVAIIIKRGKILEIASNSLGSRSRGAGYGERTIHAERAVIKKIGDTSKLNGATLVVIRIMKGTKEIGNSEPCHSCRRHLEKCMKNYGLKCVYYSV